MSKRSFYKLCVSTLIAVYLLILVGGIVRSTGSGMGCPDWPTCFGSLVPPTSVSELPSDYKQQYADYRHRKNERFAKYLSILGFEETAEKILSDESIREEADFNPVKTWIEYLNRLVGVVIGMLIFAVAIFSWKYRHEDVKITVVALLSLVLVGIQGWMGSFVVSTNLTPWTVTLHMFLALVIVALLVYLVHAGETATSCRVSKATSWWLVGCMMVLMMQVLLGTQVREAIDRISTIVSREHWISNMGNEFLLHRSFSWAVLLLHVGLVFSIKMENLRKPLVIAVVTSVLGTILSGVLMAYVSMSPFLQPVHLLLATATFGFQMMLLLQLNKKQVVTT